MQSADRAREKMLADRSAGEKAFGGLLAAHPDDGMLYFKRGKAYESLREFRQALADFQRAEALFPMVEWKLGHVRLSIASGHTYTPPNSALQPTAGTLRFVRRPRLNA